MTHQIRTPKKLIEVALPLIAINTASAKEKAIRHGHPSTLHVYWARRPLATARAVIFSQMVNDPSWKWDLEHPGEVPPSNLKATWAKSRQQLFRIIEDLVLWENTTNEVLLEKARVEIRKSWRETCEINKSHPRAAELFDPDKLPAFHDPFAGGGSIPLEAQRLGLESYASDLNPVAVLINKAMIEIPPRFAGRPPVDPSASAERSLIAREWRGAHGLAEDVRHYGKWMRDEAEKRIGHLYPKVAVTASMVAERPDLKPYGGKELTVIAWLWARTVKSPNPAFATVDVPLASSFMLSTNDETEAYVEPVVEAGTYRFTVKVGKPTDSAAAKNGTKLARGANFRCVMSGTPIDGDYIKGEGMAGRMSARLMAVVAEGDRGRVYLAPPSKHEEVAHSATPTWRPQGEIATRMTGGNCTPYGLTSWGDLFTSRQLVALTTFSDLTQEARERTERDALAAGMPGDGVPLREGGIGAVAYGEAVAIYLALAASKQTIFLTTQARWRAGENKSAPGFGRQALPMVWDFADLNPFAGAGGDFLGIIDGIKKTLINSPPPRPGFASLLDATLQDLSVDKVISTDPPYYDNIGYADLSDYFYVWLRRSLRGVLPELFATVAVPKAGELVAAPHRHGGKEKAESFFLNGMTQAMRRLAEQSHPAFPLTIYYAFKQSESDGVDGTSSTGWETFLDAVLTAGLAIGGTWPVRTENKTRLIGMTTNALASSIVLVCHRRATDAPTISRRQFTKELASVLPEALDAMTRGVGDGGTPLAPVDLSQAIIGPGMEVFTRYSAVLEADGSPMSTHTALTLINRFLADDDFDADTQFCVAWFEQYGWKSGPFGTADTLARAKGTSVEGVRNAGVIHSAGGSVRLMRPSEYSLDWDPTADDRMPVWEVLHHLIRKFRGDGERGAAALLAGVQSRASSVRQLAYRLYTLCERAGWAEDARAYNDLIASWSAIETAAPQGAASLQQTLFEQ